MRRLVILIVVLLGVEVAGDLVARAWAEGEITSRAQAAVPASVHVDSQVKAFPFLIPLLVRGRVAEVDGHFENAQAGVVTLANVDIELHGVRLDRDQLFKRKVRLVGIRDGTVSADIDAAVLSKLLHVPVKIANGEVNITVAGVSATAKVRMQSNGLDFGVPGVGRINLPRTNLLPCASDLTVLAGRVRVSCTIHNIPEAMLGAANSAVNQ